MAEPHWPKACFVRGRFCAWSESAIPAADRYWSSSPTGGPPTVQTRSPDRAWLPINSAVLMWPSLVIDCESGRIVLGLAETLSMHLGAQCLRVDEIAADQLVHAVRQGRAA